MVSKPSRIKAFLVWFPASCQILLVLVKLSQAENWASKIILRGEQSHQNHSQKANRARENRAAKIILRRRTEPPKSIQRENKASKIIARENRATKIIPRREQSLQNHSQKRTEPPKSFPEENRSSKIIPRGNRADKIIPEGRTEPLKSARDKNELPFWWK